MTANGARALYFQSDPRWRDLPWYDPAIDEAIKKLTSLLHRESASSRRARGADGTLGIDGCWHVAIASMLAQFGIRSKGKLYDPTVLVHALRDRMLGTLSGYVQDPFVDPLSLITLGRVQLWRYRDFLRKGIKASDAELSNLLAEVDGQHVLAIANVGEHEFIEPKGNSHYILIRRCDGDTVRIHDPGWRKYKNLLPHYNKIFQLFLYRHFRRLSNRAPNKGHAADRR
jgi:hypothetical protein